ncbi:hypothetical protein [Endozoicomonas sp. SESOKO1]|nr:hypothetical protein [Endozoicomonas sp. SESOKO1]
MIKRFMQDGLRQFPVWTPPLADTQAQPELDSLPQRSGVPHDE